MVEFAISYKNRTGGQDSDLRDREIEQHAAELNCSVESGTSGQGE